MKAKLYMLLICIGLCNITLSIIMLFLIKPNVIVIQHVDKAALSDLNTKKTIKNTSKKCFFDEVKLPMPPPPPQSSAIKEVNDTKIDSKSFKVMKVIATAYCPCAKCCGKGSPGITKTGRSAWLPGVAVDPSIIPLGSHIDIPGYNRNNNGSWVLCDDTGGKIKGKRIDVRFKTHEEAKRWGRREITIRVWSKE